MRAKRSDLFDQRGARRPALGEVLALLAKDLETRPASVKAISKDFAARMKALVKNAKVDLEADIDGDVDL